MSRYPKWITYALELDRPSPMSTYEKVKRWRRNAKARLVEAFGGSCAICHIEDDPIIYDFHHIDGEDKDFGLSSRIRSWVRIVAEATKCVMLCAFCHRKLHSGLVVLPHDCPKFDQSRIKQELLTDECPVCGGEKLIKNITCSRACGGKKRHSIDWDTIDLKGMLLEHGSPYAMSAVLPVSDNTIRKQLRKRGLIE